MKQPASVAPQAALIIDDHALFAAGLEGAIGTKLSIPTVKIAVNGAKALEFIAAISPDLIISDFYIPGDPASELLPKLRKAAPEAVIVIVSATLDPADYARAFEYGANGFVSKNAPPDDVVRAITEALAGRAPVLTATTSSVFAAVGLTPRQGEIVIAAGKGLSNKQIAAQLGVSPETVKAHLAQIFRVCEVSNRVELTGWVRRQGIALD